MAKVSKPFEFNYILKHKVVRDLKLVTETVGTLHIEGVACLNPNASVLDVNDRYDVDIDFIRYNGVDIKPVMEVTADATLADIYDECVRYAANNLFTQTKGRAA